MCCKYRHRTLILGYHQSLVHKFYQSLWHTTLMDSFYHLLTPMEELWLLGTNITIQYNRPFFLSQCKNSGLGTPNMVLPHSPFNLTCHIAPLI